MMWQMLICSTCARTPRCVIKAATRNKLEPDATFCSVAQPEESADLWIRLHHCEAACWVPICKDLQPRQAAVQELAMLASKVCVQLWQTNNWSVRLPCCEQLLTLCHKVCKRLILTASWRACCSQEMVAVVALLRGLAMIRMRRQQQLQIHFLLVNNRIHLVCKVTLKTERNL